VLPFHSRPHQKAPWHESCSTNLAATLQKELFMNVTKLVLSSALFFGLFASAAQARLCDNGNCQVVAVPAWMNYPDLTPISLDIYDDATSTNPRDIVICLTIANQGMNSIRANQSFAIYRGYSSTASDAYQDDVNGPIGGRYNANHTVELEFTPRLPGTGNGYSGPDPIAVTYIVDYDNEIAEQREMNNEITVLYSPSTAESVESCGFE
jgi:hypothetical protein